MSTTTPAPTETATGTEVRRWVAARHGVVARAVVITPPIVEAYNRAHPERPYLGDVKPVGYRPYWA